jgi:FMN phosphatase YigB (HAD superfamily)
MSPTPSGIEAVTFDFWDTLVRTDDTGTLTARRDKLLAVLGGFGHDVEAVVLDEAFRKTFAVYVEHWQANQQFVSTDGGAHVLTLLDLELDPAQRAAAIEAYENAAASLHMQLTDHVAEVLAELHERGIKLGIICDVGMTPSPVLRGWLADHDVLRLFDHWSFSDEVGYYKPAPEIFEDALAGLGGVAPERAAHVGDLRRTDVAGSKAMGMTAVRYSGANDDSGPVDDPAAHPEADHVVDDYRNLLSALDLD